MQVYEEDNHPINHTALVAVFLLIRTQRIQDKQPAKVIISLKEIIRFIFAKNKKP